MATMLQKNCKKFIDANGGKIVASGNTTAYLEHYNSIQTHIHMHTKQTNNIVNFVKAHPSHIEDENGWLELPNHVFVFGCKTGGNHCRKSTGCEFAIIEYGNDLIGSETHEVDNGEGMPAITVDEMVSRLKPFVSELGKGAFGIGYFYNSGRFSGCLFDWEIIWKRSAAWTYAKERAELAGLRYCIVDWQGVPISNN